MTRLYTNNFSTTLDGNITDAATSIDVVSATGLPAVGGGDTCQLTIDDGTNIEIVTCTAVSTNTLTVTRGQESTSGTAFSDGANIELRSTALSFIDPEGEIDFGGADSLEIPNGASPTVDAAGEIAIDTTITDYTGMIKYHDGTEELTVVAMPTANLGTDDGYVVSYNATNDEFELSAGGGSGDSWGDAVDADIVPDGDGTRDLGSAANRFAEVHTDSIELAGSTTVTSILDEDDLTSDSATALATQQSIKAYVDASGGGGDVVDDTSPQLGGDLDVNGNDIVSVSNGDITITPNGTGDIVLDGQNWPQADGSADQILTTDGAGQLSWEDAAGGGGGGAWSLIATATADNDATIDFTDLTSDYIMYKLVIAYVDPASDSYPWIRVSSNNGSSYNEGASDYHYALNGLEADGTAITQNAEGVTSMVIGEYVENDSNNLFCSTVTIYNPSASFRHIFHVSSIGRSALSGDDAYVVDGTGWRNASQDIDAIRFLFSGGNVVTGEFRLYGLSAT